MSDEDLTAARLEAAYWRGYREGVGVSAIVVGMCFLIAASPAADIVIWLRVLEMLP